MSNLPIFFPVINIEASLAFFVIFEALAVYYFQFRKIPGAMPLCLIQVDKAILVLSFMFCGGALVQPHRMFWAYVSQSMLVLLIFFWFEFILEVGQKKKDLPAAIRTGIRGTVACLIAIILFDPFLGWYWTRTAPHGASLKMILGPAGWATMIFCYLLFLYALWVSVIWILSVQGFRRRQAIMLSATPLFTLFGNVLRRVPALAPFDPQLVGVLLGSLYISWVFYRWRIYSILPAALDAVTRNMVDALLVVDDKGYLVEMNPTARSLFGDSQVALGDTFQNVAGTWPAFAALGSVHEARNIELERDMPEGRRHYRVEILPLVATGPHLLGDVFILKDITREKNDQARLVEQQKALSVLAERDRLGRELHDTQGQFPGYVKTQVQAIRLLLKKLRTAEATVQLEQLSHAADAAFDDARESIASLKTAGDDWDFFSSLRLYLSRFHAMSGIRAAYNGPQQTPTRWIVPGAEAQLLRIIQETLTNARKHSKASTVEIAASCDDGRLTVTIADNGQGFDEEAAGASGFGLDIIRERAAEIGGACLVASAPGRGTTIEVQIPLICE